MTWLFRGGTRPRRILALAVLFGVPAAAVAQDARPSAQAYAAVPPQAPQVMQVVVQPAAAPPVMTLREIPPGPLAWAWGGFGEAMQRQGARMARWRQPRYETVVAPMPGPATLYALPALPAQALTVQSGPAPSAQALTAAPPPPAIPQK